jgi:CubicO group peptidase (beta-lactamase class C family)
LPEFKELKVFVRANGDGFETEPAKREPTVRDLLRHTAGLTYGFFGNTPVDAAYGKINVLAPTSTLAGMTKKLGDLPLLYQPGTKWNYSVATDVLGRLVEVASGKSLDEFFAERIFIPLDMKDTGFFVHADKLNRFAATHGIADGKLTVTDSPATSAFRNRPTLLSGGGGLVSTAHDYIRFCQMLAYAGELGGKRLLRRETIQEMTKNQLPDEAFPIAFGPLQRPGVGFGLGFSVQVHRDQFSAARVGEYGWGGAASTHFWISPNDELVVIALQQFMPFSTRLEQTIKPLVYEAILD